MKDRSAKGRLLRNIRNALIEPTPQPYPDASENFIETSEEALDIRFAESFTELQGNFIYNQDTAEMVTNLKKLTAEKGWNHLFCWEPKFQEIFIKHDFRNVRIGKDIEMADAGITACEALIARTGSVVLSSNLASGRSLSIFPPVHIIIAYATQIREDVADGIKLVKTKYGDNMPSMINFMSGPSRTADIEKTLVLGAHGPKEVYIFLIDN